MTEVRRWNFVVDNLKEAHGKGLLGEIAASTKIAAYKLHDLAKPNLQWNNNPLTAHELRKLYAYFKKKKPS